MAGEHGVLEWLDKIVRSGLDPKFAHETDVFGSILSASVWSKESR
jgi:hypothetical protein